MSLNRLCSLTGSLLFAALLAQPAAIEVNSVCEVGNCNNPGRLTNGQSVVPTTFNFLYTFTDGDSYDINGSYSASYSTTNGSAIALGLEAVYTGRADAPGAISAGNDTITFDLLQNYFDSSPGNYNGTYTESAPITVSNTVGKNSTVTAEIFYDRQGVGLLGPYGPGTHNASASANLTGLTANLLTADYNFTLNFHFGSQLGAYVYSPFPATGPSSSTTPPTPGDLAPEPGQLIPIAASLLALLFWRKLRTRPAAAKAPIC